MSHDIFETEEILVTACVTDSGIVQIGTKFERGYGVLTEQQCLELAHALLSRVLLKDGYKATDS